MTTATRTFILCAFGDAPEPPFKPEDAPAPDLCGDGNVVAYERVESTLAHARLVQAHAARNGMDFEPDGLWFTVMAGDDPRSDEGWQQIGWINRHGLYFTGSGPKYATVDRGTGPVLDHLTDPRNLIPAQPGDRLYTVRVTYSHDDEVIRQHKAAGLPYDEKREGGYEDVIVSAHRDGIAITRACAAVERPGMNGMLREYHEVLADGTLRRL